MMSDLSRVSISPKVSNKWIFPRQWWMPDDGAELQQQLIVSRRRWREPRSTVTYLPSALLVLKSLT